MADVAAQAAVVAGTLRSIRADDQRLLKRGGSQQRNSRLAQDGAALAVEPCVAEFGPYRPRASFGESRCHREPSRSISKRLGTLPVLHPEVRPRRAHLRLGWVVCAGDERGECVHPEGLPPVPRARRKHQLRRRTPP